MDVTLTFLTFDLENDPLPGGEGDCKYDWLEVWDGLPGGETLIKSFFVFCFKINRVLIKLLITMISVGDSGQFFSPFHESTRAAKGRWCVFCPAYIIID